jgi:4-alpha-glucanotransferase
MEAEAPPSTWDHPEYHMEEATEEDFKVFLEIGLKVINHCDIIRI